LPGKILKTIHDKPVLEYILERLKSVSGDTSVVVCTSTEASDDPIASFCETRAISYFRGDLHDVAQRFLLCAKSYGMDFAVRINGDNIFLDPGLLREMIREMEGRNLNFMSNVKDRTFPKGMSVEIVKTQIYEQYFDAFEPYDHEHVMTYFYRNEIPKTEFVYNPKPMNQPFDFAIDTEEDLIRAGRILDRMTQNHTEYNYQEIITLFEEILYEN
jgi:spore coat polysaccharide biosynthesis protein SpsF